MGFIVEISDNIGAILTIVAQGEALKDQMFNFLKLRATILSMKFPWSSPFRPKMGRRGIGIFVKRLKTVIVSQENIWKTFQTNSLGSPIP